MPEPSPPATTEPEPVAERVSTPGVERADSTTTTLVVTETPTAEKQPDGDVEGVTRYEEVLAKYSFCVGRQDFRAVLFSNLKKPAYL